MDVAAEKVEGLAALRPFAHGRAAGVFAGRVFVQLSVQRRAVNHEIQGFHSVERSQGTGKFFFGIFSWSVKGSDVAVTQACPVDRTGRRSNCAHLAVKIDEPEPLAERPRSLVSL